MVLENRQDGNSAASSGLGANARDVRLSLTSPAHVSDSPTLVI